MAKQRRPQSKSVKAPSSPSNASPTPSASPTPAARPSQAPASQGPQRRTTYFEAVAVYERGVEALQRHDYAAARALFESVLRQYPEEKELHERVRLYLNVCERHETKIEDAPRTIDERLYASTLAINGGRYDEAIAHLRLVRDEDPDNDHALYMLAVAHAQRGEPAEAVAHLERAIALNPDNRSLARTDPDLEPVRQDEAFRIALDTPSAPRSLRRPLRAKTAR